MKTKLFILIIFKYFVIKRIYIYVFKISVTSFKINFFTDNNYSNTEYAK